MSDEIKRVVEDGLKDVEGKLQKSFEKYEGQLKESGEVLASVKNELKAHTEEYAELKKEQVRINDALVSIQQKGVKLDAGERAKSMGETFIASEAFKSFRDGASNKARMEFKNTILGEEGSPLEPTNTIVPLQTMAGIVGGAFRSLRVMDVVPTGLASGNTIHYTRELLFTNGAGETSEGAQKPEAVLTFEAVDVPVRTIAHFIKVSKQVIDDAPMLQTYIDQRMRYGVQLRIEQQVINGNGASPNIAGILASGNHTAQVATTGEVDFDFINRAKYAVLAADYNADVILVNPADWGRMERTKTGVSGDNRYVGADGVVSYLQGGLVPTLWGLPVVASNSVPAGKVIVMARDALMFWSRQGTTVEIFDQNEDDVEKNLLTIRAEARGAFTVFRPAAVIAGTLPGA